MNVLDRIRAANPHHLLVTVSGDDAPRKVIVPDVRKKWERVASVLDGLAWTRIECRGKGGDVLAVIASEAADADDLVDDTGPSGLAALAPFAKMLAEAVRHTQQVHREETRALVEGYQQLAMSTMQLLARTQSMADDFLRLARAAGLASGDSSGAPDKGDLQQLMQLVAMGMMQQKAGAAAAAATPKPAPSQGPTAHPNGVNGGKRPAADNH